MASSFYSARIHTMASSFLMTLPMAIWVTDCLFSISRVKGASMEPALKDGDIILIRKSNLFPGFASGRDPDDDDSLATDMDLARMKRLERLHYHHGSSAGESHPPSLLFSRPPLVLSGQVVVFFNPRTAFPAAEYNVKRVVGLGGQTVRHKTPTPSTPMEERRGIAESVPPYCLWVEGDNTSNSEDSRTYGPVSKKLLVGEATRILWPPSRWGKITKQRPAEGTAWWP